MFSEEEDSREEKALQRKDHPCGPSFYLGFYADLCDAGRFLFTLFPKRFKKLFFFTIGFN